MCLGLLMFAVASVGTSLSGQMRRPKAEVAPYTAATIVAAGSTTRVALTVKLPDGLVKTLGALEVAGAIGVVGPPLVGIATVLVPLAAVGLALIMLGAVAVHAARKEFDRVSVPVALLVMAAVVAWGRFGPYAFSG